MRLSLGKTKAYNLILSKYETNNKLRIGLPYKSLIKAIENQTRDNILTPEQAIEILLDGVIYEEELHQQTVLDSNAYNSGRTSGMTVWLYIHWANITV